MGAPEDLKDAMSGEQLTWAEGDSRGAVKEKRMKVKENCVVARGFVLLCCLFLSPVWSLAEVTAG